MANQNEHIRFSVVIPVYNGARTIVRTINSVLAQSYPPNEVIVVDDASTDGTCSLVEGKYMSKVQLISLQVNGGSSAARNEGMELATGDYIAFIDADDTWHADKLQLIARALRDNPNIVLFFNRFTQEELEGKRLPEQLKVKELPFMELLPGNFIATSCIVVKNDDALRFQPDMRYTEDFDFCLRVAYRHNIYYTDEPLTQIYRAFTTRGGISGNKWLMRKGEMRAYARLVNLNVLFAPLVPVMWGYSMLKHLVKKMM